MLEAAEDPARLKLFCNQICLVILLLGQRGMVGMRDPCSCWSNRIRERVRTHGLRCLGIDCGWASQHISRLSTVKKCVAILYAKYRLVCVTPRSLCLIPSAVDLILAW